MDFKDVAKNFLNKYLKGIKLKAKIFAISIVGIIVILASLGGGGDAANAETVNNADGMSSTSSSSWEQFCKFVEMNEGGSKTSDGKYYIVEDDSAGNPTVGHGLCLKSHDGYLHVQEFSAHGVDSKKLADDWLAGNRDGKVEVSICDEIWSTYLRNIYEQIVAANQNLNLKEYQYYALTDVKYRRGNIKGFTEAYQKKWTSSEDKYGKDTSSEAFDNNSLYGFFLNGYTNTKSGIYKRKKNQWLLFKYGYYASLNEYWKEDYSTSGNATGEPGKTGKVTVSGTEVETYTNSKGDTYILYRQTQGPWATQGYMGGTVAKIGCTTAASATAASKYDSRLTPMNFLNIQNIGVTRTLASNGLKFERVGSDNVQRTESDKNKIKGYLQEGYPVMIHVNKNSIFTNSEHYMTLIDINGDKVYLATGDTSTGKKPGWYNFDDVFKGLDIYYKIYK